MTEAPKLTIVTSNRLLRFIHIVFCLSLTAIVGVVEYVRNPQAEFSGALYVPFLGVGAMLVGVYFFMRSKIGVLEAALVTAPEDHAAVAKRQQLYIFIFAVSEAIVLFGFVSRFMGASLAQAVPFYAAGFVLILLSTPRKLD